MNTDITTAQWWSQQRKHYNVSLAVAGMIAFLCYASVVVANQDVFISVPVTVYSTLLQGLGYLVMMGIANICFFVGPLSERAFRPKNVDLFRKAVYRTGYFFSVMLPFALPALALYILLFHPERGSLSG